MATQSEILRFLLQGENKSLVDALNGADAALDGTESAAQRVAAQMRAMAQVIESEGKQAAAAAEALAVALGPELVASIEQAGGSVGSMVADLNRAGVAYEEIANEADSLAAAIREVNAAGKGVSSDLAPKLDDTATSIRRVGTEADQSRSVLANMVGNSVQDLGQLGGVAGTAGMALGQLAEYAADGNISLAGLTAAVGPMLGLAAGGLAVAKILEVIKSNAEQAAKATELWQEVQAQLVNGQVESAMAKLAEDYEGTISVLEQLGYTAADWLATMRGQGSVIDDLSTRYEELGGKAANSVDGLRVLTEAELEEYDALSKLIPNLREQVAAQDNGVTAYDTKTRVVNELVTAYNEETAAAARSTDQAILKAQADRLTAQAAAYLAGALTDQERAYQELVDGIGDDQSLLRLVDQFDRVRASAEDAFIANATGASDAAQKTRAYQQDLNEMRLSVAAYAKDVLGLPTEAITEILADIDERGVAAIEAYLNQVARERTAVIRAQVIVGGERDDYAARNSAAAAAAGLSLTPAPRTGGSSSRGGGGGGGGAGVSTTDPMAEWDRAMENLHEIGKVSDDEYRTYLEKRLAAFKDYEDGYVEIVNNIKRIDEAAADAREKAAAEEVKRLRELADAEKERQKAAEDAAKKALEMAEKQLNAMQRMVELLATLLLGDNGNLNMLGPNAISTADRQQLGGFISDLLREFLDGNT